MAVYVKKPIPVEAIQFEPYFGFSRQELPEWLNQALQMNNVIVGKENRYFTVRTLEGAMTAYEGDYIVQGVGGELYPCRGNIFEETYEEVLF